MPVKSTGTLGKCGCSCGGCPCYYTLTLSHVADDVESGTSCDIGADEVSIKLYFISDEVGRCFYETVSVHYGLLFSMSLILDVGLIPGDYQITYSAGGVASGDIFGTYVSGSPITGTFNPGCNYNWEFTLTPSVVSFPCETCCFPCNDLTVTLSNFSIWTGVGPDMSWDDDVEDLSFAGTWSSVLSLESEGHWCNEEGEVLEVFQPGFPGTPIFAAGLVACSFHLYCSTTYGWYVVIESSGSSGQGSTLWTGHGTVVPSEECDPENPETFELVFTDVRVLTGFGSQYYRFDLTFICVA